MCTAVMNNQPIYDNQDAAEIRKRLDAYVDSPHFTAGLETAPELVALQMERETAERVKALLVGLGIAEDK